MFELVSRVKTSAEASKIACKDQNRIQFFHGFNAGESICRVLWDKTFQFRRRTRSNHFEAAQEEWKHEPGRGGL